MFGKSTKVNRKIRKALVYYRTRTRKNRKITSTWNSYRDWETVYRDWETDRKSTRLNSSHSAKSRMPSSA